MDDYETEYMMLDNLNKVSNIKYCECGLILNNVCYSCGYTNSNIEFEIGPSRSYSGNYNFYLRPRYSRQIYMKSMLLRIKRVNNLTYGEEVYEMVIDAYNNNKNNLKITFRTFFFRLNMFKDEEILEFYYYMNKNKINIDKVNDILNHTTINKISLHYKLIHVDLPKGFKWSNRNLFIKFYYPEVYESISCLLFSTETTNNKYNELYHT